MPVLLETRPDGVILPIRAQPGARRNGLRGVHDGMLKVTVTQVAEKGKANQAIVEVLCKSLQLRRGQIELIAGETSPQKKFLIREIPQADLATRISNALDADD